MTPRPPLIARPPGRRWRAILVRDSALCKAVAARVDGQARHRIGFDRTFLRGPRLFRPHGFGGAQGARDDILQLLDNRPMAAILDLLEDGT